MEPSANKPVQEPQAGQIPPLPEATAAKPKVGIGGCLLYPVLFMAAQVIVVLQIITTYSKPHPSYITYRIHVPTLIADLVILALVAVLAVLFFRKKAILPALFSAIIALIYLYYAFATIVLPMPAGAQFNPAVQFLAGAVQCLILIPYFALSKRVQNTFVQPPDPASALDSLVKPLEQPLGRLYGWLVRIRGWVFAVVVGYLVAAVLLNALVGAVIHLR